MLAKTALLIVAPLSLAFISCSPLPFSFTDTQLPDHSPQSLREHFKGSIPIAITVDPRFEGYSITKAERNANEQWFSDRAGRIFPIGALFATYLDQAQRAAFESSRGKPRFFQASIASADMAYTMNYGFLLTYMDWVELTLTVTTKDAGGNIQSMRFSRQASVTPHEAARTDSGIRDLALRTVIQQLVFDYLDAVWRASVAR